MASVSGRAWSSRDMPHFLPWLCQPAVDAVIIQAQSMFQARMTAVVRASKMLCELTGAPSAAIEVA
jgi:hypothetical protein